MSNKRRKVCMYVATNWLDSPTRNTCKIYICRYEKPMAELKLNMYAVFKNYSQ